jgi:hypothetical protein
LWEGWRVVATDGTCPLTIAIGTPLPPSPPGAAPIVYGSLKGWTDDDTFVLLGEKGGLQVDYAQAAGTLVLPAGGPDLAFARDTLWRLITLELARTRGAYYLHGAAWLGPAGADVVCADGGTGKSTLAAAVYTAGHPVITDDGALLLPGTPTEVTALPTAWRVSEPAAGWVGAPPGEGKRRFWPSRRSDRGIIGRVLFAERGERTALLPLAPAEALTRLIHQNPLLMTSRRLAAPHLDALRSLADGTPSFRLVLGGEILSDPSVVLNLLAM